jgi:RHS repeat-associated protein
MNTKRVLSFTLLVACLLVGAPTRLGAQSAPPTRITPSNDTGTTPFGSYSTDAGNVNLSNGNLSLNIPIVSLPGRNGMDFNLSVQYDSKIWTPSAQFVNGTDIIYQWNSEKRTNPMGDLGWRLTVPGVDPGVGDVDQLGNFLGLDGSTLTLADGSKHYLSGRGTVMDAQDGSGITATNDANHNLVKAVLKDGSVAFSTLEDTNGNIITNSTNGSVVTWADTLGRQIALTYQTGPGNKLTSIGYKDPNGVARTVTLGYTLVPLLQDATQFPPVGTPFDFPHATNCQGICHTHIFVNQPTAGNRTLLTSVTLADGTQYSFSYNTYGELIKVIFPTGGYAEYDYAPFPHFETFWSSTGFNIQGDFREVTARRICREANGACGGAGQTPEDQSTFTPTINNTQPNNVAMDVVDPLGYRNHYEFSLADTTNHPEVSWPRETLHSIYSEAGSLLRTTQTTYYPMETYCFCPLYPKDVTTTLSDTGGTALVTKTHYDYDTFTASVMWPPYDPANGIDYTNQTVTNRTQPIDNPIQILEYLYASGAPGSLARKTVNTWLKVNAANGNVDYSAKSVHIWNRKATSQVWDGGTTKFSETQYEYDNYSANALSASGATQHDAAYTTGFKTRGNLTAIKRWRNTDGAFITTQFAYDDAGNAVKQIDPLTHTTLMNYADSWGNATCAPVGGNAAAYLTSVTDPLGHSVSAKYNSCNGSMSSFADANSQLTSYAYDLMGRNIETDTPDGGQVTRNYFTSPPPVTAPFSVVTSKKLDVSRTVVSKLFVDGLARTKQTVLCEDGPTCGQQIFTDTTYDGLGRVSTVSNPYRTTSDSTYGLTKTVYDALNRTCVVVPPDGTPVSGNSCPTTQPANDIFTTYAGDTTTVTDQAGKKRKSRTDALGRLTDVWEDPNTLNYQTVYNYDPLNNLTGLVQNGSHNRTFVYNSLSQLTSATNPESGAITYTYDLNGNLQTRTGLAPNQAVTGTNTVTTTYTYDVGNRLTGKTYNDCATPSVTYNYDEPAPWGFTLTNYIGRLTTANTTAVSGLVVTKNLFNYDPMGRTAAHQQCVLGCGGNNQGSLYTYDSAGNVRTLQATQNSILDFTITYGYDNAGRPNSLTSNLVDATHPASLASIDAAATGYYPQGAVRKMNYANGLTETSVYNNRLQPCRINVNSAGSVLGSCGDAVPSGNVQDFNYGFNAATANNGNVASWSGAGNQTFNRIYTYDALNRLSTMSDSATAQACKGLSWTYDPWGNRTDQNLTAGTCGTFHSAVGTNNRLSAPYQYDPTGNMTADGSHTYTYDAENRLIAVDGGSAATYLYDAEGHRVIKSTPAAWRSYIYDATGSVVAETNAAGWDIGYVSFNGSLLAEYRDGTTYFVHKDHIGSTRLISKLDQTILDSMDYLPFGEQLGGDTGTTHKFSGKERDSTSEGSFDNFGARYYSSSIGRYVSADWSDDPETVPYANFRNPQSINLYSFTGNNPLSLVDLDGHVWVQNVISSVG